MNIQQWMPDEQEVRITGEADDDYDPEVTPPKYMTIRREAQTDEEKAELAKQQAEFDKLAQAATSQGLPAPEPPPELLRGDAVDIQFQFDVTSHDGAMPGTDQRSVAAASRLIEAAANPAFQPCFNPTVPGNIDPKALLFWTAKKAGLPTKNFLITRETAQKNLQSMQQAQGVQPPPGTPNIPPPAPPQAPGIPSAGQLPPIPSAAPPQAQGVTLTTQ